MQWLCLIDSSYYNSFYIKPVKKIWKSYNDFVLFRVKLFLWQQSTCYWIIFVLHTPSTQVKKYIFSSIENEIASYLDHYHRLCTTCNRGIYGKFSLQGYCSWNKRFRTCSRLFVDTETIRGKNSIFLLYLSFRNGCSPNIIRMSFTSLIHFDTTYSFIKISKYFLRSYNWIPYEKHISLQKNITFQFVHCNFI